MSGGIYVLKADHELVTLSETQYDSEDLLQTLLAKNPSILAGDRISPAAPRKWLLVKREVGVPDSDDSGGRWSLDHLFLDQDGIPTLVEVKRSTDSRIRREVVGQMLDYAANAMAYWSVESIQGSFERTCEREKANPDEALAGFLGPEADTAAFWQAVKINLQAGRVRLLFVADEIPDELRRIVEFLNSQMDPAEVLAVEIKQFAGASLKTLVPRGIGQTAEAEARKAGTCRPARRWDVASFFAKLEADHGPEPAAIARRILEWARRRASRIVYGGGSIMGSMIPVLDHAGMRHSPFAVWTYARIETHFEYQSSRPPFNDVEKRRELLRRLNDIPGVSLPEDSINKRPSLPLVTFRSDDVLQQFLRVAEWYFDEVGKA